jgi:hypothetical protein
VQHQVQIVNHEIEHDSDVRTARLKRCQPQALDVAGTIEIPFRRPERAVVSLDMTDLKLYSLAVRRRDQLVRFGERGCKRLFHQHRHSMPQCV